ncbi:MAG: hypothetical protein WBL21_09165 [Salinimicrobium sp.]
MDSFRTRPETDFIHKADWEGLFILSRHLKRDVEFYVEDLNFLNRLINKYAIWVNEDENLQEVKLVQFDLHKLIKKGGSLVERLQGHMHKLTDTMMKKGTTDPDDLRKRHESMEKEISQFVNNFRRIKKEVFRISEKVIGAEKLSDKL